MHCTQESQIQSPAPATSWSSPNTELGVAPEPQWVWLKKKKKRKFETRVTKTDNSQWCTALSCFQSSRHHREMLLSKHWECRQLEFSWDKGHLLGVYLMQGILLWVLGCIDSKALLLLYDINTVIIPLLTLSQKNSIMFRKSHCW